MQFTIDIVALQELPFNSLWQAVVQLQQRQEADNHLQNYQTVCRCCKACQLRHRGLMEINIQESNRQSAQCCIKTTPGRRPAAACCRLL
jgi:7-cyano-7-deazaguanine synthase in queuosine biosynthesis